MYTKRYFYIGYFIGSFYPTFISVHSSGHRHAVLFSSSALHPGPNYYYQVRRVDVASDQKNSLNSGPCFWVLDQRGVYLGLISNLAPGLWPAVYLKDQTEISQKFVKEIGSAIPLIFYVFLDCKIFVYYDNICDIYAKIASDPTYFCVHLFVWR